MTDDAHRDPLTDDEAAAPSDQAAAPATEQAGAPARTATGGGSRPAMPDYRGGELDAERGPGLGCFWFQVVLLVLFIILTPLTVELQWPPLASAILLFVTLGLLLFVGQTVIFLLRIVAAERRGRRRPLASPTRTVGEIEESAGDGAGTAAAGVSSVADGAGTAAAGVSSVADGAGTAAAGVSSATSGQPGPGTAPAERPDGVEGMRQ